MSVGRLVICLGYGLLLRGGVGMMSRLQAIRKRYGGYVSRLIDALLAGHVWWRLDWQELRVIGLIALYGLFLLFASVCPAAGSHHHNAHHQAHQQHPGDDTDHSTGLLDPCDFALRALNTSATHTPPLPSVVLLPGQALAPGIAPVVSVEPPIFHTIRAPPAILS